MAANMFARARVVVPQGARSMATLKEIDMRLKSVTSIAKITKSMKMVASAKFARAQRSLLATRPIGPSSLALIEKGGVEPTESQDSNLIIGISSDRGLCGGIHSAIAKRVRAKQLETGIDYKLAMLGDKARGIMARTHQDNFVFTASNMGKKTPTFSEAVMLSNEVTKSCEFDSAVIYYNHFKNAASYITSERPVLTTSNLSSESAVEALSHYEDVDEESTQNYSEFTLANNMYYCMIESATSEQSSRMTSMENATNNAGDMIDSLRLRYNRTRQAVITTELIEIISGSAALEDA